MKKYSKPILKTEKIMDINEPIFLNSGDIWSKGLCFYTEDFDRLQDLEEGRYSQIYECNVVHTCVKTGDHINYDQNYIFFLSVPIPTTIYITMDSMGNNCVGTVSPDGMKVLFVRENRKCNPSENIGIASFTINWDSTFADELINTLYVQKIEVNDVGFQLPVNTPNPHGNG